MHERPNSVRHSATNVTVESFAGAHGKVTINGKPNRVNYCVIFVVYIQFTNVAADRMIQPGGPRFGGQFSKGR
jgi:hypothetical protein